MRADADGEVSTGAPGAVLQGISFFPRGGSAHVVRYLSEALRDIGWRVRIVAGSVGGAGQSGHAETFYRGLPVHVADFTSALDAWRTGADPLAQRVPLHASYEDKPGAPDRCFGRVSPTLAERQVQAWQRVLAASGSEPPDVLHLHHLTPLHDAAQRLWPQAPTVTHLHGTELLMLEEIGRSDPPWPYASYWVDRLGDIARRSDRVIVASPHVAGRAVDVLKLAPGQVAVVPNGVDTHHFRPLQLSVDEKLALLREWLVDEPQGWNESGRPGSVRYSAADLSAFIDPASGAARPVLFYVGRFTRVKRVTLLLRAYARVRLRLGPAAPPLIIWGGYPGEWEGEHPYTLVRELALDGVFFVGWRGHDDLQLGFACADLLVAPSVNEAFGSVYLEAMAAGLPVVATASGTPATFLNQDPTRPEGWLVQPDDEDALVDILVQALTIPGVMAARAAAARAFARSRFSWRAIAEQVANIYQAVRR